MDGHAASASYTGDGFAGSWTDASNWSGSPVPGTGDTATFNGDGEGNVGIALGSGIVLKQLLFDTANAAAYVIGQGGVGSQTLTLNNGGSIVLNPTVVSDEVIASKVILGTDGTTQSFSLIDNNTGGGSLTVSGPITGSTGTGIKTLILGGSTVGTLATGYDTISGVISDGTSGQVGVTKTGTGTWVFSGLNTFTGAVNLNAGTLLVRADSGVGGDNMTTLPVVTFSAVNANGGTFGFDNSGVAAVTYHPTVLIGTLTLASGDSSIYVARASGASSVLSIGSYSRQAGATLNFIGTNTLNTFGATSTSTTIGVNGWYVIAGQATGFIDAGVFYGGNNYASYSTYTTDTRGGVGAMVYGASGPAISTVGTTSIAGTYIQASGSVTAEATNTFTTLDLNGNATNANVDFTLVSGATVTVNGILRGHSSGTGGSSTISGGTAIRAANNAEMVIRTDLASDTLTINTAIQANGTNMLTKSGAGALILGGNNTFTGGVTIDDGIVRVANAGALNSAAPNAVTFGGGASTGDLQLNGNSLTVAGVGAVAASPIVENANASAATLTLSNTGTSSFAGTIQDGVGGGALALTKSGTGTQTLAGTNTYTGATTVSGGILNVTGSLAAATTTTVTGATLEGTGTLNGAVHINTGGVIAPGTVGSIGTLVTGALSISSGTLSFELNSDSRTADLLAVNGGLTLTGATLSAQDLGSTALGTGTTFTLATYTGALTGTFAGLANGSDITIGDNIYQINYGGGDITLQVIASVPEPGAWAMLLLGLAVLLVFRGRLFRRSLPACGPAFF